MTQPSSTQGCATVISSEEPRFFQYVTLRIDGGDLFTFRPCHVTRASDGQRHEVSLVACPPSNDTAHMSVRRMRRATPVLAPGDVLRWDTSVDADRRHVHGPPFEELLELLLSLESRNDVDFPARIANGIEHAAENWAMSPWFDHTDVDSTRAYRCGLRTAIEPALPLGKPLAAAVYLESVRRVLHTLVDVRRGRLPRFLPFLLSIVDAYDPLATLTAKDRERARPLARALEEHALVAILGDHARLAASSARAA